MKITINFNNNEKTELITALGVDNIIDNSKSVKGRFGTFKYNNTESVEIDLTPAFFTSFVNLISLYINFVKSFVSAINIFVTSWFDDLEVMENKENLTILSDTDIESITEDLITFISKEDKTEEDNEYMLDYLRKLYLKISTLSASDRRRTRQLETLLNRINNDITNKIFYKSAELPDPVIL